MTAREHRNALQPGYKLHWYEIKSILGQGGFGITYLAHDTNLDRLVAIKEYLPTEFAVREADYSVHPASDNIKSQFEWGLDRFISEARTLSKFEHPNIVRVYAVFEENNTGYMVMPYEKGHSLQAILSKKKTLNEATLLSVIEPLLDGLNLIHREGFIHRDIKPDNIFIREDGSPVLLDFGSARQAIAGQTKTLTTLVTPGYAPFEQYYSKSDEQGPWTDIYGLGATLYRAISGRAPMDAVDRSKSMLDGTKDNFVTAAEIGLGQYSEKFLSAVDHAICFKVSERPQTVSEWHSEITTGEEQVATEVATNFDNIYAADKSEEDTKGSSPYKKWLIACSILLVVAGGAAFYLDQAKQRAVQVGQNLQAYEDEKQALTLEVTGIQEKDEKQQAENEQASPVDEGEQLAEANRKEDQRIEDLEKERVAEEKRLAEQRDLEADKRRLEEERRLQAARQLELDRQALAEERRRFEEETRRQEEQRLAEIKKQQQLEEQQRLAEQQRIAAEKEKKRLAEEQRIIAERLKAEAAEKERLAEIERQQRAEEQRRLELQKQQQQLEEQQRLAEEKRQQEAAARLRQAEIEQKIESSRAEFSTRTAVAQDKLGFVDNVSATDLAQSREKQVSISVSSSIEKWQNTGVEIIRGNTYKIRASGQWSMGPLCKKTGPTGDDMYTIACWDLGHQTVAKRSHSALVGKIGQQSLAFFIGSEFTFTADKDGVFYMMSNDAPGFFFDNTGAIDVSISLEESQ